MLTRRATLIGSLLATPTLFSLSTISLSTIAQAAPDAGADAGLGALEAKSGGRLGVAVLDLASGRRIGYRAGERFAMCSTFKFLAAALVLARVDRREEHLDRRIVFSEKDLVPGAPVTKDRVGTGMTLAELCEAALTRSDNTAANLLLESFGGPPSLTAYARSLNDLETRLDRVEPALNEASPGDPRDTTTPQAMLENLRKLVLGDALAEASRAQLTAWLVANKTGDARLRAGLPTGWRVGDKTGSGGHGATNDIAVIWRSDGTPIIVVVYFAESPASDDARNAVLADVGRMVAALA
jgi:beta-lactamase class A